MIKSNRITGNEKLTIKDLKAFMNLYGLSRREFSEILGITVQGVTLWLNGKRDISVTISRLVRLFKKYPRLLKEF